MILAYHQRRTLLQLQPEAREKSHTATPHTATMLLLLWLWHLWTEALYLPPSCMDSLSLWEYENLTL